MLSVLRALFTSRLELVVENHALRQQLSILHRTAKQPKFRPQGPLFWATLSSLWKDWRSALLIVKPETVVKWHRQGFQLFWRWKTKVDQPGRPKVSAEIRDLIRRMSRENPLWGVPRIQAELRLLGFNAAESTVAKYRIKVPKPPSQIWRTFLDNHFRERVSIDLLTVPTATFRVLYVLIVLAHDRCRVLHFNVTEHPTAAWTARANHRGLPGRDCAALPAARSGSGLRRRVPAASGGNEDRGSDHGGAEPRQNAFVERLNGSIRRECLAHVIISAKTIYVEF